MKYRWGFLDENDTFTECFPRVEDSTSLDYAQQSGEMFYRAKLNGEIDFRFEFEDILSKGYDYEHRIVLQYYDSNTDSWGDVWMGRFALTDCTINYDTNTISVQPETIDRYTKILDDYEKEYNLVKLKAVINPVNILVRPCLQIYKYGSSKISNFIGGNSWDTECDSTASVLDLTDTFKFKELRDCIWFTGTVKSGIDTGKQVVYYGRFLFLGADMVVPMDGRIYNTDGTYTEETATYNCLIHHDNGHKWLFSIQQVGTLDLAMACFYDDRGGGDESESYTEGDIFENTYLCWDRCFGRTICNTEDADVTIDGTTYTLFDIASTDMAGINLNYNKVIQQAFASIEPSIDTDVEPTSYPQDTHDRYFVKPANTPTKHYWAASPETWIDVAYWWWAMSQQAEVEEKLTATRKINDAYDYRSVIFKLLNKAGVNPTYIISHCLGGSDDYVGARTNLRITAKSNVISSYYDTPAQNVPISLSKVLNMLKIVYQCYWYIDGNGNMHIEHISYYDNGYSTTETTPTLLVDLESEQHTKTLNNKVYGQNQVKFDKTDMYEQFTFGWADAVTRPFIGYPINCLDKYVQKGSINDQNCADFTSDVDFVLSSPNDTSKEGLFLFALPAEGANYINTLKIETVTIEDEDGEEFDVTIQNADASFVKIHETWWRWHLPCERINVNNQDTNALSTGSFKTQSIEFADLSMADILANVDNCNLVIRTQQGDGHIKTLSINLNSLTAKADLVFNFIGRWYYLKGTALGASFNITINGEQVTINVSNNSFIHRYKEAITALTFDGADVVSVDFSDCDNMDNLTSCDNMFKNCDELIAVDFASKKMSAVLSANDMFEGCANLTTLICPDSSTWKADLDFSDCPLLTTDSLYDLIKYLYIYDSGVHTITPNTTMWQALDSAVQDDLIAKAAERGWTIGVAAQYSIVGQSAANTVYATINGTPVEIPVTAGSFQYDYNTPITSISFEGDADVTDIDFSLSDGLVGLTSLNDAFKDCAGLTSVDFTNCDLSNVASASNAFANCGALYTLEIPTDTWLPDVDLSASVMPKSEMLNVINGLYTYTSGTHTITFNSTIWDAMSVADQQLVFDAADAKGWTTNAAAVVYYIRGKSSKVNDVESFLVQFIEDNSQTPSVGETIECSVDSNGNFEYGYVRKKLYNIQGSFRAISTLLEIEIDEPLDRLRNMGSAFRDSHNLSAVSFPNATFADVANAELAMCDATSLASFIAPYATFANAPSLYGFFARTKLTSIDISRWNLANCTSVRAMFQGCTLLTTITKAINQFDNVTIALDLFDGCTSLSTIDLSDELFTALTNAEDMFRSCSNATTIDVSGATFSALTNAAKMFQNCTRLTTIVWNANLNLENVQYFSAANNYNGIFSGCSSLQSMTAFANFKFNNLLHCGGMFWNCTNLTNVDLHSAEFNNLQSCWAMFQSCNKITTIDLPQATFANLVNGESFAYGSGTNLLTIINLPSATMPKVTNTKQLFQGWTNLTTINLPSGSTAILPTSTPINAPIDLRAAPLTYQSMLNVANWVCDLSGYSAHTITFKASAWNALSTAEQTTIQGILSGKNWNLATA